MRNDHKTDAIAGASVLAGARLVCRYRNSYEYEGKSPGYTSTYRMMAQDSGDSYVADVFGHGVAQPTAFRLDGESSVVFSIHPRRRILNSTFDVVEEETQTRIGALKQHNGFGRDFWTATGPAGCDLFSIASPESAVRDFVRQNLGGFRKVYVYHRGGELLGFIRQELRPLAKSERGFRKIIGRMLSRSDWALYAEEQEIQLVDRRMLLSAGLMLLSLTTMLDKSN